MNVGKLNELSQNVHLQVFVFSLIHKQNKDAKDALAKSHNCKEKLDSQTMGFRLLKIMLYTEVSKRRSTAYRQHFRQLSSNVQVDFTALVTG